MNKAENQKRWIHSEAGTAYRKSDAFRESIKAYNRKRDRLHRAETQRKVRAVKIEMGCCECGYNLHHAALEFHHRDPALKKFRLGESRNYSWKSVEAEIAKCNVMCSNCHAVLEHDKRVQSAAGVSGSISPS